MGKNKGSPKYISNREVLRVLKDDTSKKGSEGHLRRGQQGGWHKVRGFGMIFSLKPGVE